MGLIDIIRQANVPKVILRYIMMNFLDLMSIKRLILTVREMNVLDNYSKNFLANVAKGFFWNYKNDRLDVVQWLYYIDNANIPKKQEAFLICCENSSIAVAQWLYSLDKSAIDIHYGDDLAFRNACQSGRLKVAQWLYSLGGVNIHANDDVIFNVSCVNNHLDVAKWLYSIGNIDVIGSIIDVNGCSDFLFRCSCNMGHLEVAQWIYSLGNVDIHAKDDYVFKCSTNEIKKWLESIN